MILAKDWVDYRVIATGNGQKLEDFNGVILLRPDPQVIWDSELNMSGYKNLSAEYLRSSTGGGEWKVLKNPPARFTVTWRKLKFELKLMGFKHTGIFPEQAVNWARMDSAIRDANRPINVLNLFAYTGGATVACINAGAHVTHVDAAKSMCDMAKNNVQINNLDLTKARYIVDDCIKFCEREIKRGKKYDAIIMDPPSYGRGPKGEMWKIEDQIFDLVKLTKDLISDTPLFYLINSYTTGLQPTVMKNILDINFKKYKHESEADEIGMLGGDGVVLPCGCSAFLKFN